MDLNDTFVQRQGIMDLNATFVQRQGIMDFKALLFRQGIIEI